MIRREEPLLLPPLGEVLDFLRLVWAVDHALQRRSKQMESELGITGPQRVVLRLVGKFPGISASQLAQVLKVHRSTVSGILERLARRKLLERRTDPRDARRSFLGLTAAGRAIDLHAHGTVEDAVKRALNSFPPGKISAAKEVLSALADALD
jgi:DNA-binding MarR family transcriptional regulator